MQPQGCRAPAVYYHFKAKEEIVLAVLEPAFVRMRAFVSSAEAASSPAESAEIAMRGLVDLTIDERQVVATLFRDPDVERIVQSHHDVQELIHRLGQMLLGPNPDARRRVAVSVLGPGLAHAGLDPQLADVDDVVLRDELVYLGRTLLVAAQAPVAT